MFIYFKHELTRLSDACGAVHSGFAVFLNQPAKLNPIIDLILLAAPGAQYLQSALFTLFILRLLQ